jgi:acetoacetyl-CoA reductase
LSTIEAECGAFGQTNYGASKAGILGFTRSLALEVARSGITVNAICPGYVETAMLAAVPEKVRQAVLERIPMGRFGRPEDIARCVRFLVTEGEYVTGQALHVNGGLAFS